MGNEYHIHTRTNIIIRLKIYNYFQLFWQLLQAGNFTHCNLVGAKNKTKSGEYGFLANKT